MNPKEHIQQELEDAGISHPSEWRKALGHEDQAPILSEAEKPESKVEAIKTGEINNESWQRQLDTAFQQNDYELIKTLRKVRPESAPSAELIQSRMRELVTTRPSKWVEDFGNIKSISSDVELDQALVADEFGKLFEKFAQEKGVLEQLKEFKRATGYTPSPEAVQSKYRSIFAGKKSYSFDTEDLIKDVKGLTGLQPDKALFQETVDSGDIVQAKKLAPLFGVEVTSEMIQQAYEAQFEKKGYLDTYRMSEIGEKPNQTLVEKAYQKIIEKRGDKWMDSLKSLEQATGIKPVFTKKQMRPIFEEFLQRGWYGQKGYVGIEHLTEMTGMRSPVDLVEKTALKIVDGGHGYIDQGKGIKEGLKRLEESVGVAFEIPESEIQDRYQKAIADKKAHIISNLHGALGIRPSVDKEVARQFMVGLMDETYHNPISELEGVFGIKFKATKEEIETKQGENLEKLSFDKLFQIQELTGMAPDQAKLQEAVERYAEQKFNEKRNSYYPWDKELKKVLEKFTVRIPENKILSFYHQTIEGESVDTTKIKEINELFGQQLPADMAQVAYKRLIQKGGYIISTIESVYQLSGNIKPELSTEEIYAYNIAQLEDGWPDHIEKLAKITGENPEFKQEDIQALYKKSILNGKAGRITNIQKFTGVQLELDNETAQYVSQKVQNDIETASTKEYTRTYNYDQKEFDKSTLEQDLKEAATLMQATGIKPDEALIQAYYQKIFSEDQNWKSRLEVMTKSLGISPSLPAELIQERGQQLLESGRLGSFETLLQYGQFSYDQALVENAYQALFQKAKEWEKKMRDEGGLSGSDAYSYEYFVDNFADRLSELQKMSGIEIGNDVLAQAFFRNTNTRSNRRSYNSIGNAVEFLKEKFGKEIDSALAQDIYNELFANGNLEGIGELKKKTGLTPEVATESVREKCDDLLGKRDFNTLANIKTLLNLETLPLTPEVVQSEYTKLIDNPKFATYGDKDIDTFYKLYKFTQVRPELSEEQTAMAYRRVMFASYDGTYEKFERVVGVPPTESDLQNRIYNWLIEDYLRKDNVTKFMEKYKVAVSPEIAQKSVLRRLEKTTMGKVSDFIKSVKLIEEVSGTQVRLESNVVEAQVERVIQSHKATEYSCTELDDLFSWFEEYTGQKPSKSMVDSAYVQTLGQTISYEKTPDGEYLKAWDWLKQKYGLPSPKAVQQIYLAQLASK